MEPQSSSGQLQSQTRQPPLTTAAHIIPIWLWVYLVGRGMVQYCSKSALTEKVRLHLAQIKSFSHSSSFTVVVRIMVPAEGYDISPHKNENQSKFLYWLLPCSVKTKVTSHVHHVYTSDQGEKNMETKSIGWNVHFSCYHSSTYACTLTLTLTPVTKIILPMSHDRGIVLLCSSGQTNRFENLMWTCCLATWKKEGDNLKFYQILQTKVPWKYSFHPIRGLHHSLVMFEHVTRLTCSYSWLQLVNCLPECLCGPGACRVSRGFSQDTHQTLQKRDKSWWHAWPYQPGELHS